MNEKYLSFPEKKLKKVCKVETDEGKIIEQVERFKYFEIIITKKPGS